MKMKNKSTIFFIILSLVFIFQIQQSIPQTLPDDGDWTVHGRDPFGSRYSPLTQINRSNVSKLKEAWTISTGELSNLQYAFEDHHWVFECSPLVVNSRIFVITPVSRAIALDGVTGDELWSFDPKLDITRQGMLANRGVAYWSEDEDKRIFLPVRDGRLICLNAKTGMPISSFGDDGVVNLRKVGGKGGSNIFISSPPVIYKDLVIQGFGMPDGANSKPVYAVPLMAFDVHTGNLVWTFNTIPQEGEFGTHTWENHSWKDRGCASVWSIMTVDPERGIVYLPVSTPHFDFYGGDRHGDNLFGDSVVALEAANGKYLWHYQTVHHDLWDYDLPAPPNLVDIQMNGKIVPAVAQIGKTGFVYLLNRETGIPIFPIEEKPVPASDVKGELASKTQPMPDRPPAFTTQGLTEEKLSRIDDETCQYVLNEFRRYRSEGIFTPPSLKGSVVFPGFHGGGNWSGGAVNLKTGMLYVNSTELACTITIEENPKMLSGFKHTGWPRFRDQNGYPANAPPWGQLSKIDLNKGEIVWQKPLGEFEELTKRGIPITGQENFGGASVTAGGLVFIASTMDEYLRAFDEETGEVLMKTKLNAAGYAIPVTYLGSDGKQYIAVCAGGGGKLATPKGDYVQAFCLSD